VVTIGEGKFYSLGLDLELMASMSAFEMVSFSNNLQKLLARLLTFPLVTVAAINGDSLYTAVHLRQTCSHNAPPLPPTHFL